VSHENARAAFRKSSSNSVCNFHTIILPLIESVYNGPWLRVVGILNLSWAMCLQDFRKPQISFFLFKILLCDCTNTQINDWLAPSYIHKDTKAFMVMGYVVFECSPVQKLLNRSLTTCSVGCTISQNRYLEGRLHSEDSISIKPGGLGSPQRTCAFRNPAPQHAPLTLSKPAQSHIRETGALQTEGQESWVGFQNLSQDGRISENDKNMTSKWRAQISAWYKDEVQLAILTEVF